MLTFNLENFQQIMEKFYTNNLNMIKLPNIFKKLKIFLLKLRKIFAFLKVYQ
jgi:hypothetical protein